MNKRLLVILFVILIFVFTSCTNKDLNELSKAEQNTDNSCKPQSYMTGNCSKNNVKEFMSVFGEQESGGYVLDKKHCYNVTPQQIAEETSAQIFKFSDSCASFLYLDNQVYQLGEGVGGYGFVNAVLCDFDHDGNKDILYTYSWGSGQHRSVVAVFNTQTMENTVICNSFDTDKPNMDLYVCAHTPSGDIPNDEIQKSFVVYTVNIEVQKGNFANLGCVLTDTVGSIESENGIPVFHKT